MSARKSRRLGRFLAVVSLGIFALGIFAQVSLAQTSNMVLLKSLDRSVAVSGKLVGAVDGQYKLNTIAGIIAMDVNAVSCTGAACPVVVPIFKSGAVVKLLSSDGAVDITGNITDIVDDHYVVDNVVLGSVRINTDMVECSGPGCPTGLRFAEEIAVIETETPAVEAEAETTSKIPAVESEFEPAPEAPAIKVESETTAETPAVESEFESAPEALTVEAESETTAEAPAVNTEPETDTGAVAEADGPENTSVSFAGSDTVGLGLLPYLLTDYANRLNATVETDEISETETLVRYVGPDNTELSSVYVKATGSGDATGALETKAAVFGMTTRQIRDDEARRLIGAGSSDLRNSDNETVIAVDSLAVITHPSNPVSGLSLEQLGAIYLGQIDNWSEVGGFDAPITVLSRDDGVGTRSVFEQVVFDGEEPRLAERVTYPGGDDTKMAASVKQDPLAIGYVGFAHSEGLNRLDLTSDCGITSTATPFAVKTEEYPLGRRLYLYNRADNTPEEAKDFLEYVLSSDADDAIAQSSFVNFAVEREPLSPARYNGLYEDLTVPSVARLANQLRDDLNLWDRLSTTVRFRTASFRLDKKEQNDIDRLVQRLSELPPGTQIAAIGFTDDVGPFAENLRLSNLRARTVADAIQANARERALNVEIDIRAFSELSPSVCNTDSNGRAINRRVEIWIRK